TARAARRRARGVAGSQPTSALWPQCEHPSRTTLECPTADRRARRRRAAAARCEGGLRGVAEHPPEWCVSAPPHLISRDFLPELPNRRGGHDRPKERRVARRLLDLVEQELRGLDRAQVGQGPPQQVPLGQLLRRAQQLPAAGGPVW